MGYAAHLLGLEAVYLAGGAQAIAAMTYGTETLMPSDKLFGPGNAYVTAAKQLAQLEGTAIDMPAGPSELLVVADGADEAAWVAADLLSQAEHGPDSQVILVTDSASLAEAVPAELERQLADLPRRAIAAEALRQSRLLIFPDLEEALAFSNHYAPEHLIIQTQNPRHWAMQVVHAGSVFLGRWSCESAGDYNSGTNHTLPTAGAARAYSGVSVDSFVRQITFQQLDAEGLRTLGPDIEAMARAESLEAHARAVARRRQVIPDQ
jgi:histidinol dehydrogenase